MSQPWYPPQPGGPPPYPGPGPDPGFDASKRDPIPEGRIRARFGTRVVARLIDGFILAAFCFLFFIVASFVSAIDNPNGTDLTDEYYEAWAWLFLFGWGLSQFLYDWVFHVGRGRTPGKMLLGIQVVRAYDGGPITQGQAVGRAAIYGLPQSLPCFGHLINLVDCLVALDADKGGTALHDKASATVVVVR
ncbi:RDD family protein [Nocardiopsis sediminis]|uniref:RDD family protein n=1 Tax=Nocardiopsis sediminis TaxID=1778267 RepID=A0ABV8FLQ5_9ACTN